MKGSKIWLELDLELVEGLVERLAKSQADFARKLHRQLDEQLRPYLYTRRAKQLTKKDSLGPEVLNIKARVMKARGE